MNCAPFASAQPAHVLAKAQALASHAARYQALQDSGAEDRCLACARLRLRNRVPPLRRTGQTSGSTGSQHARRSALCCKLQGGLERARQASRTARPTRLEDGHDGALLNGRRLLKACAGKSVCTQQTTIIWRRSAQGQEMSSHTRRGHDQPIGKQQQ